MTTVTALRMEYQETLAGYLQIRKPYLADHTIRKQESYICSQNKTSYKECNITSNRLPLSHAVVPVPLLRI